MAFVWHTASRLDAAIAESLEGNKPLVVLVGNGGAETGQLQTQFERVVLGEARAGAGGVVLLSLGAAPAAAAQFAAVFAFPRGAVPALHAVVGGARTGFVRWPTSDAGLRAFGAAHLGLRPAAAGEETLTLAIKLSHSVNPVKAQFNPADSLSVVRQYIIKAGFVADFDLVQPYPLKVFSLEEEASLTLASLGFPKSGGSLVVKKKEYRTRKIVDSSVAEKQGSTSVVNTVKPAPIYDSSALSIRMPDGSNIRSKFAASDTLASVREFIKQTLASTSSIAAFEIVQVHPSRFFSISDEERSLKDLDLLPSASLLVKFSLSQSSAYPASSSGIVSTLLTPFQILFSWISLLFIWLSSQLRARTPSSQQRATLTGDHPQQQSASNTVNDARAAAEKRNESRFKSMADLNREKEEKAAGKDSKKESSYNGNSTAQDF